MWQKTAAGILFISALSAVVLSAPAEPTVAFSFRIGDFGQSAVALAVDAQGNSYVAGSLSSFGTSTPFPITENAVQKRPAAMFIAKVDARGERIVWATFLGGSRNRNWYWRGPLDYPRAIATDSGGNVIVIGSTAATDFPVENAVVSTPQPTGSEGFLTKISADGSRLLYSTYLGGHASAVATDAAGFAYVAISGSSVRLPFERLDLSAPGVMGAVVIAKFNPSGQPVMATRLGTAATTITAIASDPTGGVIISGATTDRGFPLVRPIASSCWRGFDGNCTSPYVAKLDPSGSQLVYSTLLGGRNAPTTMSSMAVDPAGSTLLAGSTRASDFPVLNAYQTTLAGGEDYVLTKISATGTLEASTYLGGEADESSIGTVPWVLVDAGGRPTLLGATQSLKGVVADMAHPDVPLWRSDDHGFSWHASASGLRTSAWAFAVSERDRTWYVGAADGVYRSTDGGASWQRTTATQQTFALAVDPAHPGTVYAAGESGTLKSENHGVSWTLVDAAPAFGGPYHTSSALVVDGNGTVFLGTEGIRRSSDGGRTWIDKSSGLEKGPTNRYGPVGPIVFDPNVPGTIYALHYSRPYRSRDGGESWTRLNPASFADNPFGVRDFHGLAVPAGRRGRLYASGWTEVLRSDNDGADWIRLLVRTVPRAGFVISPARADTIYAFDSWAGSPLLVSHDGGDTWAAARVPTPGQRVYAVDPLQPSALFAPAGIRTLPLLVRFGADLRHVAYSSFLDFDPPTAVTMDLAGSIYLIRSVDGRSVLVKLLLP